MSDSIEMAENASAGLETRKGFTLKSLKAGIDAFMKRKGMVSRQWKTYEERQQLAQRQAGMTNDEHLAVQPQRPHPNPLPREREKKKRAKAFRLDDLWSKL